MSEVKLLSANNSIQLSPKDGTLPAQMSDDWINYAALRLAKSDDPGVKKTAQIILDALRSGNIVKVVTGVNSKGATAVKIN
jgi:filamentous hemagglutinin